MQRETPLRGYRGAPSRNVAASSSTSRGDRPGEAGGWLAGRTRVLPKMETSAATPTRTLPDYMARTRGVTHPPARGRSSDVRGRHQRGAHSEDGVVEARAGGHQHLVEGAVPLDRHDDAVLSRGGGEGVEERPRVADA
jgi:hypothetical protein